MPTTIIPFPYDSQDLEKAENSFTAAGVLAGLPMFVLFQGTYFFGDVLEGHWNKWYHSDGSNQYIMLDGSGDLDIRDNMASGSFTMTGVTSTSLIPLVSGTIIDVHLKLNRQADDAYATFRLSAEYNIADPWNIDNYIEVSVYSDGTNYKILVRKEVDGTITDLIDEDITNAEGTFRISIDYDHVHIYFHDGSGAIDESVDEVVTTEESENPTGEDSPFIEFIDQHFGYAYPMLFLWTDENANTIMTSEKATISYPKSLDTSFFRDDFTDVGVKLSQHSPELQVYDEEHDWTSQQPIIQNNFLKIQIAPVSYGFYLWYYDTSTADWEKPFDRLYFTHPLSTYDCEVPRLLKVVHYSREKVVLKIRFEDTTTEDYDYYVDALITLERGRRYLTIDILDISSTGYYLENARFTMVNSTKHRWGYVGDAETHGIGDDDLGLDAENTTLTDNFLLAFDDDATLKVLGLLASTHKPDSTTEKKFMADDGGHLLLKDYKYSTMTTPKILLGLLPFSKLANLFVEAEYCHDQGWHVGGVKNVGDGDDSGDNVELDAQNDEVYWLFTAGTDLPAGRYLMIVRAKDSNQVQGDLWLYAVNNTDGKNRNEEMATVTRTCTASYTYFDVVFDITDEDVSDTDQFKLSAGKTTADANTIKIDYFLLIPMGTGEDWPQDLSHSLLRHIDRKHRL